MTSASETGVGIRECPPGVPELARANPECPQPAYAERLARTPMELTADNRWSVYSMEASLEINHHPDILGAGGIVAPGGTMGAERPLIPLDLDGAEHRKFRRLLDPVFAPKRVANLEPRIRARAAELIDGFVGEGRAELYGAFCTPLPSSVFVNMMGIPEEHIPRFLEFKDDVIRPQGTNAEEILAFARAAGGRTYDYFNKLFDEREHASESGDDLIDWLMGAEVDGHRLTRIELLDLTYLLMIAGLDTVTNSLSCLLAWLARHPEERRRLTAHPELWSGAIEELLRIETPVMSTTRTAAREVTVQGRTFPAGTVFGVSWAAANLDPALFDDPLEVKLDRAGNRHVAFASGWHRCLGSHLARLELRVAMEELHRRLPDYAPDPADPIEYTAYGVRGATHLPLVWG